MGLSCSFWPRQGIVAFIRVRVGLLRRAQVSSEIAWVYSGTPSNGPVHFGAPRSPRVHSLSRGLAYSASSGSFGFAALVHSDGPFDRLVHWGLRGFTRAFLRVAGFIGC